MQEPEKSLQTGLGKKLALAKEYLAITEKMQARLEQQGVSGIRTFFGERQHCIGKIRKLDRSLAKIIPGGMAPDKRSGALAKLFKSIKAVLAQAALIDPQIKQALAAERATINGRLVETQRFRQAAHAYHAIPRYPSKYLDTRR